MINRSIGIDLAIRGDHVAQIYDDGRPVGRPIRFRHEAGSLDAFLAKATSGIGQDRWTAKTTTLEFTLA